MPTLTRWSMTHRRTIVALWVIALVTSLTVASGVGNTFFNSATLPGTGAQRAADLLQNRFPSQAGDSDQIVLRARTGTLNDPKVREAIEPMLAKVATLPHVTGVDSPYAVTPPRISPDGTTGFATVAFDLRGDALPLAAITRVIDTAQAARSPQLQIELGGSAIEQTQRPTLGAATAIGIGAAVIVLLLTFGSFLAMGLPILTALFGIGTGMGVIALLTHVIHTPDFASELALLIGLGVGVDYALFVVTRFRDAYRTNGGDIAAAVELAMSTAGRSITFAGICVVIAVLGLFAAGVHLLYGVAIATSLTVLLILAASLTLLPALLAGAGHRIGRQRPARQAHHRQRDGLWARWIGLIQRRPGWSALAATALLLALIAPVSGLRLAMSDAGNDQPATTTRQAYDVLAKGFGPGFNGPLVLAVSLPFPRDTTALTTLTAAVRHAPGVASVAPADLNTAGDTASITVFPTTSPQSNQTYQLVRRLRNQVIPPIAKTTGITVDVGGFTASQVDFAHVLAGKLPLFIGVVIAVSALLLLIVFRSLLIPLQAAVMNLLSIGASLGVVQAIFERGWLSGLVGAQRSPIEAFIPVIVFAIVFGLSMDYEVFLVSRIHEEWQRHGDASAAVREGLIRTGRVITAAAAVMMVVFASFAVSSDHILKLFGLTLASAVFIDALIIRTILLPAVLQLLGPATWTLPRWLNKRLPRLVLEPPREPAVEPAYSEVS